jgi:hypothetical protein
MASKSLSNQHGCMLPPRHLGVAEPLALRLQKMVVCLPSSKTSLDENFPLTWELKAVAKAEAKGENAGSSACSDFARQPRTHSFPRVFKKNTLRSRRHFMATIKCSIRPSPHQINQTGRAAQRVLPTKMRPRSRCDDVNRNQSTATAKSEFVADIVARISRENAARDRHRLPLLLWKHAPRGKGPTSQSETSHR